MEEFKGRAIICARFWTVVSVIIFPFLFIGSGFSIVSVIQGGNIGMIILGIMVVACIGVITEVACMAADFMAVAYMALPCMEVCMGGC